jgi:hypothetical protein
MSRREIREPDGEGRGGEEWRGKKGREERRLNRKDEQTVGHNSASVGVVVHLSAVPREAHSEESEDGQTV